MLNGNSRCSARPIVLGEPAEAAMVGVDAGGAVGYAVVLEFVNSEPQVTVL